MTTPTPDNSRILPELPLAIAVACVAFAGVCSVSDIRDRPVLAGFFLTAAAAAAVVAVVMGRRQPATPDADVHTPTHTH